MQKEVNDITNVCDSIRSKANDAKLIAEEIKKTVNAIMSKTSQEDSVEISLSLKKELTGLFILNSNFEDNLKALHKIKNSFSSI
jgi:hypothetical protein